MPTLNDFNYVDNVTDIMAAHVNNILAATLRAEYRNVETLTANRTMTDADCPVQVLTASGASRDVSLPAAATTNHAIVILNAGASLNLVIKSGTTILGSLAAGQSGLFVSSGATWVRIGATAIAARYTTAAGQSISDNTATIVNFGTVVNDTHSAVTVGAAWAFVAPVSGYYHIAASIIYAGTTTWADAEAGSMSVSVNGVTVYALDRKDNYGSAATVYMQLNGSAVIYLAAADSVNVRTTQRSGAALALFADANQNHISIIRVG